MKILKTYTIEEAVELEFSTKIEKESVKRNKKMHPKKYSKSSKVNQLMELYNAKGENVFR